MKPSFLADPRKKHVLMIAALILICAFCYSNTLQNGFLLDDYIFLIGDRTLNDVSFGNLFTWGYKTNYRPVAFSFLKLELSLFGDHPAGYHVINIAFFIAICCLFFWIFRKLTDNEKVAFFAACLFASHPINNMLVNYKTAVNISIYIVLMQSAFLTFMLFEEQHKRSYYYASLALYFTSLFAHEIAFILPVYLFLYTFLLKKHGIKESLARCLPYGAPFLVFLVIRLNVIRANVITSGLAPDLTFGQYMASLYKLIGWYHSKLIYPDKILFLWDERVEGLRLTVWIAAIVVLVLAAWALSFIRGRGNLKCFLFNYYLIGFAPTLITCFTFTKITGTAMIEPHWFVFSLFGLFCLIVLVLYDSIGSGARGKYLFITMTMAIISLCVLTRQGNAHWKNDVTYCNYWINVNPLNGSPHDCRAWAYIRDNDKGQYFENYEDCGQIANLAGTYHLVMEEDMSIQYYLMALKKNPTCVEAFSGLANYYMDVGDYRMAEGAIGSILALDPGSTLGNALVRKLDNLRRPVNINIDKQGEERVRMP